MLGSDQLPARGREDTQPTRKAQPRWQLALLILLAVLGGVGPIVWLNPAALPQAADLARAALGPDAVAQVETLVFQTQDSLRRARYQATGAQSSLTWSAPQIRVPVARREGETQTHSGAAPGDAQRVPTQTAAGPDIPQIGWAPLVADSGGLPLLERALVRPDPDRPYVEAAVVRIDLQRTQLHLMAGTQEPRSAVRARRPGAIPAAVRQSGTLLAAFNGGFKAVNGRFGMAADGVTLLPPKDGLATLAIRRDGQVDLGVWGQGLRPDPDIVALRQNCPLLVDRGAPVAETQDDNPTVWGQTVGNKVATWRSGLGLSVDRRYLFYAVGDGLTVASLAQTLAESGAEKGMQLDINSFWTRFVTYAPGADGHSLEAQKLVSAMQGDPSQFLTPDTRDFFYITLR
jgi:hypothetical protein